MKNFEEFEQLKENLEHEEINKNTKTWNNNEVLELLLLWDNSISNRENVIRWFEDYRK